MQTLVNRTARELAREYFNGRLSFNDYRESRRKLIDQVTGLESDTDADTETEPKSPPVVEQTAPANGVSGAAATQDTVSESKGFPLPVILLLVVGGLGAAGWLLFSGDDELPSEPLATTTQETAAAIQAPMETDRAVELVSDFVQADDWNNDALANFVIAWSALDVADQERARSASGFRPLEEGLREEILEQRALGELADADGRETVLMSFAEHLGVLSDLQQAVVDTDAGSSEPVTKPRETVAEVQEEISPPVEAEPVPEIVQPVEDVVTPPPASPVEVQPESPAEKVPPTEAVVTSTVTKPAAKPAPEPVPEPAPKPAPAPEPVQAKSVPVVSAPAPANKPVASKDPCPASLVGTRRPVCRDTLTDGEPGPVLVALPAGGFQMGGSREDNEKPVRRVEIGRPFAISAYEVSRADYQRFCRASGANCPAGHWSGDYAPMTNVSWNDANAYVQWLSQVSGATYRLPSEAEWEYAARAGTATEYPFGEGDKILPTDARFDADAPLPVNDKSVNANRFRLRHIIGNVREWVADVWLENYQGAPGDGGARLQPDTGKRAVRGGSYADDASQLRAAARGGLPVDTRDKKTGFRVVREIR